MGCRVRRSVVLRCAFNHAKDGADGPQWEKDNSVSISVVCLDLVPDWVAAALPADPVLVNEADRHCSWLWIRDHDVSGDLDANLHIPIEDVHGLFGSDFFDKLLNVFTLYHESTTHRKKKRRLRSVHDIMDNLRAAARAGSTSSSSLGVVSSECKSQRRVCFSMWVIRCFQAWLPKTCLIVSYCYRYWTEVWKCC